MSHKVSTCDIYEASYYLTLGANIDSTELVEENKKKICSFTLTGNELFYAQKLYFNCEATVNIWDFRRCLTRINSLVGSVRANAKKKTKQGGEK